MKRVNTRLVSLILLPLWLAVAPALIRADDTVTVERLKAELAERDKVIIDLLQRVTSLEKSLAHRSPEDLLAIEATSAVENGHFDADVGAGGLEVDALAAERALERSLVQQGARLLGPGQVEWVPTAIYSRIESPSALSVTGTGQTTLIPRRERDILDWNLGVRVGLPFATQLDVNLPYRSVHHSSSIALLDGSRTTESRTGSGLGNITVGLAKQLTGNRGWRPSLVGRAVWITGTGEESDDGVPLGADNKGIGMHINAYWRNDPLVFLMSGGYTHYLDDGLRPGNRTDFSVGTSLAVSPETALTFSLDQSYSEDFERDGRTLTGTDSLSSVLNLSSSTILGRGLLLRVNAGIGLTDDAPDYRLGISMPLRWQRH